MFYFFLSVTVCSCKEGSILIQPTPTALRNCCCLHLLFILLWRYLSASCAIVDLKVIKDPVNLWILVNFLSLSGEHSPALLLPPVGSDLLSFPGKTLLGWVPSSQSPFATLMILWFYKPKPLHFPHLSTCHPPALQWEHSKISFWGSWEAWSWCDYDFSVLVPLYLGDTELCSRHHLSKTEQASTIYP